jgi:hypothetical protein
LQLFPLQISKGFETANGNKIGEAAGKSAAEEY